VNHPTPSPTKPKQRGLRAACLLAVAAIGAAPLLPLFGDANATLHEDFDPRTHDAHFHHDVPGAITLAEMIVRQRAAKLHAPPPPLPAPGSATVQLGAFGSIEAAERHLRAVEAVTGGVQLAIADAGAFYRLEGRTGEDAAALCRTLQAQGFDCFVRTP
jgi:hypothetical protein